MERTLTRQTPDKIGEKVRVAGWVQARRDHGKLIFVDLRDRSGLLQVIFGPDLAAGGAGAESDSAGALRPEWVIEIEGTIAERPKDMVNPDLATGRVELKAEKLTVLNRAEAPPFDLTSDGYEIGEEPRLAWRYLDLRRDRLQKNLRLRSRLIDQCRQFLFQNDFVEVETPYLTKATPEGARDFVVPSRHHPGNFFALPQSPQQYKQLLMVAGFERYFQVARAFRDEDLRADRGYEHTQIDLEMSFVTREEVMAFNEEMISHVVETLGYKVKEKPFPRLSYQETLAKYKTDRPDLREARDKKDGRLAFAWVTDFPFFKKDKEENWTFTHNPFSAPLNEHEELLLKGERVGEIIAQQYDLVLNGTEIAGGSVRSHKGEVLRAVLGIMGYEDEMIEKEFSHMIKALSYGAPPHGGIAYGVERIVMTLTDETSIREVQAFPQTASGQTSVMDAPSPLTREQLKELGLEIKKKKKEK